LKGKKGTGARDILTQAMNGIWFPVIVLDRSTVVVKISFDAYYITKFSQKKSEVKIGSRLAMAWLLATAGCE